MKLPARTWWRHNDVKQEVENLKDADEAKAKEKANQATRCANKGDEGDLFIVLDAAIRKKQYIPWAPCSSKKHGIA